MSRTTEEIIKIFNGFVPFDDHNLEYDNESYFYDITDDLRANSDGFKAIGAIIELIEKYPDVDFGSPGPLVHALERFDGQYEEDLYNSLKRRPTALSVWMLNRIINAEKDMIQKAMQLNILKDALQNDKINESTKESINSFLEYQANKA